MRTLLLFSICFLFTSCWPTSVSFMDKGSMPVEWKTFSVKTLEINAPTAPMSYAANLTEAVKDGIQNNTRLLLDPQDGDGEVSLEGSITNYIVTPVALQQGDNAAQNRLTISVNFNIYISAPDEDKMTLTSTRFMDYDASKDLSNVESLLLEEINKQIVQDVINKLLSNW
jgi:outer membrane lipopolysaccharide assembly protein LptE/RlpB